MNMRPRILPFPTHACLAAFFPKLDQLRDLHGVGVLDPEVDQLAGVDSVDRGGEDDVRFYVAW